MRTADIDQAEWGSRLEYPDGHMLPWAPDKWVIHYGGGPNEAGDPDLLTGQLAAEAAVLRSWQRFHIDDRGWQDIAYNYAIGQSSKLYRLRGENRAGATRGDHDRDGIPENHEARAVVFILGGSQQPTESALDTFRSLWAADPMPVIGHRDVFLEGTGGTSTQCPGNWLAEWIDQKGYRMPDTHDHKVDPASLPRKWADSSWPAYVDAGGSTLPESRVWEAYREDIAWFWAKFVKPLDDTVKSQQSAIGNLSTRLTDLQKRVTNLESGQPGGSITDGAQVTISGTITNTS